jgi:hypothetical protein
MELDSGKNWLNAASLGARALIYLDRGDSTKSFFEEKFEISPIRFPRFRISLDKAGAFRKIENISGNPGAEMVRLVSDTRWENVTARNIYCLVEGSHPELKEELVIVEAFYDSTSYVLGVSPGADEAGSIATLLAYARSLKEKPSGTVSPVGGHIRTCPNSCGHERDDLEYSRPLEDAKGHAERLEKNHRPLP